MNVWVILGGLSEERDVSVDSGSAVADTLLKRGHVVWTYDLRDGRILPHLSSGESPPGTPALEPQGDGLAENSLWVEQLLRFGRGLRGAADVAFLALHGGEGEDGTLQAILGSMRQPYTGSGPAACAIAMDKALSKRIMMSLGIPTPPWHLVRVPADPSRVRSEQLPALPELPVVVKPVAQGSSVGIGIVHHPEAWVPALLEAARVSSVGSDGLAEIMIEAYIPGRELTVGILRGAPLPVVEITPRDGFYDYEHKYVEGASDYQVPAAIGEEEGRILQENAVKLFTTFGCRGMARIDYRFSPAGIGYCLELNTIPGLTSTSLLPKAAQAVGFAFGDLLEQICQAAIE